MCIGLSVCCIDYDILPSWIDFSVMCIDFDILPSWIDFSIMCNDFSVLCINFNVFYMMSSLWYKVLVTMSFHNEKKDEVHVEYVRRQMQECVRWQREKLEENINEQKEYWTK